jgi:hypothetical protein
VFRALRDLREIYPTLRYLLVGSVSPNYDVRAAVARAGLEQTVTVTGYVDRAAFEEYVAAADICVNLRHPTAGETSASLLRLLGAGRPTLVTSSGSFAELPAGVAAQVDPDASEGELIVAYCRLLLDGPDLAAALGAGAQAYVAREHTLDGAAAGYMRFLAARYGWGEVRKSRERPLWELTNDERRTTNDERRTTNEVRLPAPNSQLPTPNHELAAIATSLAELGVTEDDTPLLEGTARAAAELFGAQ